MENILAVHNLSANGTDTLARGRVDPALAGRGRDGMAENKAARMDRSRKATRRATRRGGPLPACGASTRRERAQVKA